MLYAYLNWQLLNSDKQVITSGQKLASDYSVGNWHSLALDLDIDLSADEKRTGYLVVQLRNDGYSPVYFDDFTIHHPQDQALVSQENHYYPFGMALSGVAINTVPVTTLSKEQYNEGSPLQDELLGPEAGVYSTFFRTYDPVLARFNGVDPLADVTSDWSPYQFAMANPIAANDPTGALSQGDIDYLYTILDAVNHSASSITGLTMSFNSTGGGEGAFRSVEKRGGGRGDGNGNIVEVYYSEVTYSTWSSNDYLQSGNDKTLYPAGFHQFIALVVGESGGNKVELETKAIASTIINRIKEANTSLSDPKWLNKISYGSGVASSNFNALKDNYDYNEIINKMSVSDILKSSNIQIQWAVSAYKNWNVDYSNPKNSAYHGEFFFNRTDGLSKSTYAKDPGSYIRTLVAGATTFYRHR